MKSGKEKNSQHSIHSHIIYIALNNKDNSESLRFEIGLSKQVFFKVVYLMFKEFIACTNLFGTEKTHRSFPSGTDKHIGLVYMVYQSCQSVFNSIREGLPHTMHASQRL